MASQDEVHKATRLGEAEESAGRAPAVGALGSEPSERDLGDEELRSEFEVADELEAIRGNAEYDLEAVGLVDRTEIDDSALGDETIRGQLFRDAGERASWSPAVVDGWHAALGMAYGSAPPPRRSQRIL